MYPSRLSARTTALLAAAVLTLPAGLGYVVSTPTPAAASGSSNVAKPWNVRVLGHTPTGGVTVWWMSNNVAPPGETVTGFKVRAQPSDGSDPVLFDVGPGSTATLEGLTPGLRYLISVATVTNVGVGSYSNSPAPAFPGVTPTAVQNATYQRTPDRTQISVSWDAPSNSPGLAVAAYTVTLREMVNWADWGNSVVRNVSRTNSTPTAAATSTTFTDLDPSKQYTIGVVARTGGGNSPAVVMRTADRLPYKVRNLSVNTSSNGTLGFSFTPGGVPSGGPAITSYEAQAIPIFSSTGPGDPANTAVILSRFATSGSISGLENGVPYFIAVKANSLAGAGPWQISGVIGDPLGKYGIPAAVPGPVVSPYALRDLGGTAAMVSFSNPANSPNWAITRYVIELVNTSGLVLNTRTVSRVDATPMDSVSQYYDNLDPYTNYRVRVTSFSPGGKSPVQVITIPPTEMMPAAIRTMGAQVRTRMGTPGVLVWWSVPPASNGCTFSVQVRNGGSWEEVAQSWDSTAFVPGGTAGREYRVVAVRGSLQVASAVTATAM